MDRTEWHRIVTFQDGLVEMLEKHAKKGRLVYVSGKLQTRKWRKDGEDSDRFSTEILLAVPGGRGPAFHGSTRPDSGVSAAAPSPRHDLVLHGPGGRLLDPETAPRLDRGNPVLRRYDQVDGREPQRKRQLGGVEDRARRMSASCTGSIGRGSGPPAHNARERRGRRSRQRDEWSGTAIGAEDSEP